MRHVVVRNRSEPYLAKYQNTVSSHRPDGFPERKLAMSVGARGVAHIKPEVPDTLISKLRLDDIGDP